MANVKQERLDRLRKQVADAIRQIRAGIHWKPGKDIEHLQTRIHYGHLPADAELSDYDAIISSVVRDPVADVYSFLWHEDVYPTVVAEYGDQRWLVMFSLSGIMETAFPPSDPDQYLADPRFHHMGTVQELLS